MLSSALLDPYLAHSVERAQSDGRIDYRVGSGLNRDRRGISVAREIQITIQSSVLVPKAAACNTGTITESKESEKEKRSSIKPKRKKKKQRTNLSSGVVAYRRLDVALIPTHLLSSHTYPPAYQPGALKTKNQEK